MTYRYFYYNLVILWMALPIKGLCATNTSGNAIGSIIGSTMDRVEHQADKRLEERFLQKEKDLMEVEKRRKESVHLPSFTLTQIKIIGNHVIQTETLRPLWSKAVGKTVTLKDIQTIAKRITRLYRSKGYILSFARVIQQTVKDGAVTLEVVEGYIDHVDVIFEDTQSEGGTWLSDLTEKFKTQRPLTKKFYERYLLLIRDLYPNAKGYLKPSVHNKDGAATMQLVIPKADTHGFNLGINNFGSDSVGPWMLSLTMERPAPWNPEHDLQLRYSQGYHQAEMWSGGIGYTLPINSEGTSFGVDMDVVRSRPAGALKQFNVATRENEFSAFLMHPFIRSQDLNLYGNIEFEHTNQVRYIKATHEVKKERSRRAKFALIGQWSDQMRGTNYIKASLIKGLRGMNSVGMTYINRTRPRATAHALYYTLDLKRMQHLWGNFSLGLHLVGQYANSSLLDIDRYRSRGFPFNGAYTPAALSGDSGLEGKIELAYTRQDLESLKFLKVFGYFSQIKVWNRYRDVGEESSACAKGLVFGSQMTLSNKMTAALMYGHPFDGPVGNKSINPQIGVSLNWSF